jgi:hypothetical protein
VGYVTHKPQGHARAASEFPHRGSNATTGALCPLPPLSQRNARMVVIIPPAVDRGGTSYPLMAKMRTAPGVMQVVSVFGFTISTKLVPVRQPRAGEPTGVGAGGPNAVPPKGAPAHLGMPVGLREAFAAKAEARDKAEAEEEPGRRPGRRRPRRTKGGDGAGDGDDGGYDDDRWL